MSGRKWYLLALLAPIIAVQFGIAMFAVSRKGNIGKFTPIQYWTFKISTALILCL